MVVNEDHDVVSHRQTYNGVWATTSELFGLPGPRDLRPFRVFKYLVHELSDPGGRTSTADCTLAMSR